MIYFYSEWKGGRQTSMCKGNINRLSGTPQLPHNPGMCPDEIKLVTFHFCGTTPNPPSHTLQAGHIRPSFQ